MTFEEEVKDFGEKLAQLERYQNELEYEIAHMPPEERKNLDEMDAYIKAAMKTKEYWE